MTEFEFWQASFLAAANSANVEYTSGTAADVLNTFCYKFAEESLKDFRKTRVELCRRAFNMQEKAKRLGVLSEFAEHDPLGGIQDEHAALSMEKEEGKLDYLHVINRFD